MTREQRWTLDDIPWDELQPQQAAQQEELFYMVCAASLVEIGTDLYTRNLVQHFAGDDEVTTWLERHWEPEEMQHGRALREYVRRAWPDFDWDGVHAAFSTDYGALCTPELLMPQRSLELVSRCVVEMGTSSYYTMLRDFSQEPVLKRLAGFIYEDEVRHYKHFYKYFRRYRQIETIGRGRVAGTLWRRLAMVDDEDAYIALRHIYAARHPGRPYDRAVYRNLVRRCRKPAARHFPHRMSAKMLLKPLEMAPLAQRFVQPVAEGLVKRAVA